MGKPFPQCLMKPAGKANAAKSNAASGMFAFPLKSAGSGMVKNLKGADESWFQQRTKIINNTINYLRAVTEREC